MNWLDLFLEAQAAERYASLNTLSAYRRDLEDFNAWVKDQNNDLETIDRQGVEDYLVHCDAQGLSQSTRARRLSSIRGLFRFAFEEGFRKSNPAIQIKGPGRAKSLPKTLAEDEVDRLLAAAATHGRDEKDQARNKALVEMLYATGLRVSELCSLPVAAVRG